MSGSLNEITHELLASEEEIRAWQQHAGAARSKTTERVYEGALKRFEAWSRARVPGRDPLPADPAMVSLYLSSRAAQGRKYATIAVDLAAIAQWHENRGIASPTRDVRLRTHMRGIANVISRASSSRAPIMLHELRLLVARVPMGSHGARLRAMLTLGWYAALRRSELCALRLEDVRVHEQGLLVHLRRSKTDAQGKGFVKAVPRVPDTSLCPENSLSIWLDARGREPGWLFVAPYDRTPDEPPSHGWWARQLKRLCARAGLDPHGYGTHGLRVGWATEAARRGAHPRLIQAQLGHASPAMALRYVAAHELWQEHPGARLF